MAWYNDVFDFASDHGGAISAVLGGVLGGTTDGQDQVTVTKPYMLPGQEQSLTNFMNTATERYQQGPQQYYPDQTVAGLDPTLIQGQNLALGAVDAQKDMVQGMSDGASQLMSGGAMIDGFNLPDQIGWGVDQGLAHAVTNPIYRNLEERIMPAMDLQATNQGAFGGTRQAQMKGQAAAQATEQATEALARANLQARQQSIGQRAGDISAQIQGRGQDIQQNQNAMQNIQSGLHYMPSVLQSSLAPGNTMMDIGADRTRYEQQLINADQNRWNFEQQAPDNAIDDLGRRINMQFKGGTTTAEGQDATWMDALGGAATGVSIYNDLFRPAGSGTSSGTSGVGALDWVTPQYGPRGY